MVAYTQYTSDARPRREAESLAMRGDDVDFIGLNEPGRPCEEMIEGVRVIRLPVSRYRGKSNLRYMLSYAYFFLLSFLNVGVLFFRKGYGIVYVHTMPDFMAFTALVPRILGSKVILDIHDTMPELFATKFNVSEHHWFIRLLTFQEVFSAKFAHRVVATHDLHREIFVRHGIPDTKIFTSINYADPRLFFPGQERNNDDRYVLIYHGTIAQRLGLDIALRAVASVVNKIPKIEFQVIGDGDSLPSLLELAKDLGIEEHIYFSRKMLPLDQIPEFIRQADIGIVPNRTDEATANMMPVKLLEYVAMEKPVIAARTKVIQHYFSDGMVKTFTAENIDEFAQCILYLYQNPSECKSMMDRMKVFNQNHNWQLQKELFYNLIDTV